MAHPGDERIRYPQIVVQSFPDPTKGKWLASFSERRAPKWRRDGRELYFIAFDGKLMAVPKRSDSIIEAGTAGIPLPDAVSSTSHSHVLLL